MYEFAHLHVHSDYSFLDGISSVEELIDNAIASGHRAIALTDHGNMCGAIRFYRYAKENNIKPIVGQEFYYVHGNNFRVSQKSGMHLVLLAKNCVGYKNLVKLSTFAHVEGFYYNPRINLEVLSQHSEGLICLTACLSGVLAKDIRNGDEDRAKETAVALKDLFGDDLYIELQTNTQEEQVTINKKLMALAEELGIQTVVTSDVHYNKESDFKAHDAWGCVKFGHKVSDLNRLKHEENDYHFNVPIPEYLQEHTKTIGEIIDKCDVEIELGTLNFPKSDLEDPMEYIRSQCLEALNGMAVFIDDFSVYSERLERELKVIEKLGFGHYFVIIDDIMRWCREQGIRTGPARGSGAGSLVCYLLGIIKVNPIEHNLIFERFLHEERISPPDLDLDFQQDRRGEVIDYITQKYGADHVSPICTFAVMKTKNALKDAMRVLGIEYKIADEVSKMVWDSSSSIEEAVKANPDLQRRIGQSKLIAEAVELAKVFEGHIRQAGTHAAGIVISPVPLDEIVPLQRIKGEIATQFDMRDVERLGLLKMDILGLRTLTVIEDTIQNAIRDGKLSGEPDWNLKDPAVYDMIRRGDTKGCFMIETPILSQAVKDFDVKCFEDLTLVVSIYRPVTMNTGQTIQCLENKENPESIKYIHPSLKPILEDTYGVVVYQEQIMEIFRVIGEFTWPESDTVRSLISKGAQLSPRDKKKKLSSSKHRFDIGTQKNKINSRVATKVWDLVKDASYGFNKSHATSYATISYQAAWLKHYLPEYYMAAVLSSVSNDTERVAEYVRECRRMDLEVVKPHVALSKADFFFDKDIIRFGLSAIKSIGYKSARTIERAMYQCKCSDLKTIVATDKIFGKKKILEALACSGALDDYIVSRRSVVANLESICKTISSFHKKRKKQKELEKTMGSLFEEGEIEELSHPEIVIPSEPEFPEDKIAVIEKDYLGVFLTNDPLDKYREKFMKYCATTEADIENIRKRCEKDRKASGFLGGVIVGRKAFLTRNGDEMARVEVETIPGVYTIVCFPNEWAMIGSVFKLGNPVIVKVNTTKSGDFACRDARHIERVR